MKSYLQLARERCREPITVMLFAFSVTIGGGWGLNSIIAADRDIADEKPSILSAEPDIAGYVLRVEDNHILVTGHNPNGSKTAIVYSFKEVKKSIQVGMQVKVWSLTMLESYPAQAEAEQIKILDPKSPEKSPFTRAEAIKKALDKLALGNALSVTFIKDAIFDEKTLTWNVSIHVGRNSEDRANTTIFELAVNNDGVVVKKNNIPEEKKEVHDEKEQGRVMSREEAFNAEISLISDTLGKSKEDTILVIKKQNEFSDIIATIETTFPHLFTGAIHAGTPDDEPQIYLKGPVTPEVRAFINKASFPIKIIDKQPYAQVELEKLHDQAIKEIEKIGYDVLSSYFDIEPASKIQVVVREKEGLPTNAEGIVKLLPQQFASLVEFDFLSTPTVISVEEK